jgi:hypothetical protein
VIRWADGQNFEIASRYGFARLAGRGATAADIRRVIDFPDRRRRNRKFSALHLFCLLTAGGICNINCRKIAIADLIRERKAGRNKCPGLFLDAENIDIFEIWSKRFGSLLALWFSMRAAWRIRIGTFSRYSLFV